MSRENEATDSLYLALECEGTAALALRAEPQEVPWWALEAEAAPGSKLMNTAS